MREVHTTVKQAEQQHQCQGLLSCPDLYADPDMICSFSLTSTSAPRVGSTALASRSSASTSVLDLLLTSRYGLGVISGEYQLW